MKKSSKSYFYEDTDSEDEEEEYQIVRRKKNSNVSVPRFIKNKIQSINTQIIIVNVGRTQYDVVQTVAEELGWQVETSKKSQKWDVMWIDSHIEAHDLFKLNQHQKISHYPAIYVLTKKNFLGRSLMKMGKMMPKDYNFFPETWSIPSELSELLRYDEKSDKGGIYIFKPEAQAQGKGIRITEKIEEFQGKTGIVQVYINNPFLIEGLKFDLRIYVLIMGFDPLRIFIYDEGLGRFATEYYQKAKKRNLKDVYMHLTNYAINKNNHKFVFNKSSKNMEKGHKRSLTAIYNYLSKIGVDTEKLKKKIDEVIVKTLIVGQPMIAHTYGLAQADNSANDLCFQILGFDILINDELEPILLQVNHTPSFKTDTPLDLHIKKNLIKDTLKLLNINVEKKREKINKRKEFIELRSQRKLLKPSAEEKEALRKEKQKERDEFEEKNLGRFRKVFPTSNLQQYIDMIDFSNKIFNEHNGFKNKQNRQLSRPKSSQRKEGDITPLIAAKRKKQNKTVGLKNKEIGKEFSKFPVLHISPQKNRNYSLYMSNSLKEEMKERQYLNSQKVYHLSCDPEELKINLIQKELATKGNFVSPKVVQFGEINERYPEDRNESESKILNSNMVGLNPTQKKKVSSLKSSSEAVSQMNREFPLCRKIDYEEILNSLKQSQRREEKVMKRVMQKKRNI